MFTRAADKAPANAATLPPPGAGESEATDLIKSFPVKSTNITLPPILNSKFGIQD